VIWSHRVQFLCNFLWQWMTANKMNLFISCVFAACLIKVVCQVFILITFTCGVHTKFWWLTLKATIHMGIQTVVRILQNVCGKSSCFKHWFIYTRLLLYWQKFTRSNKRKSRSQWPRSLRRGSATARLLGLRFRIPLGAWMSCLVRVEPCQARSSAPGWSLVQRSPKECSVSVFMKARKWGGLGPFWSVGQSEGWISDSFHKYSFQSCPTTATLCRLTLVEI